MPGAVTIHRRARKVSRIYGQLSSNGRVFIVNPAGIVIGPSVLGLVEVDQSIEVVALIGLAFVLFFRVLFDARRAAALKATNDSPELGSSASSVREPEPAPQLLAVGLLADLGAVAVARAYRQRHQQQRHFDHHRDRWFGCGVW